jgi:hypothetical protein
MYDGWNDKNISISIKEKRDEYQFKARYSKYETAHVQNYINRCISPSSLFALPNDYFDANTELKDGTKFYIKSVPGRLEIKFNKRINSEASCQRMKNMYEGLKRVLARAENNG